MGLRRSIAPLFGLLGAVALIPYLRQFHGGMNDEGIMIAAAERVLAGQVPYRDFDMNYPPATFLVTAAWMAVFGRTAVVWRALMAIGGGVLVMLVWLLSDELLERPWSFLPATLMALVGVSEWPIVSYHWTAITALTATAWLMARWMRSSDDRCLLAWGMATGLSGACLQSEGAAAMVGAAAALLLARQFSIRTVGILAGGVALIWFPLLLWLGFHGAVAAMYQHVVWRMLHGLYRFRGSPYSLRHIWSAWSVIAGQWPAAWNAARVGWALQSVSMALLWTFRYGLLLPILAAGLYQAWRVGPQGRALGVLGVAWLLLKHDRLDMLYANYLSPMLYLALTLVLSRLPRAATVLVGALFVVNFGIAQWQSTQFVYPVATAAGTLYAADADQAAIWRSFYGYAAIHSPPRSTAFAFPYVASFYPLSGTINPTRIDLDVPGQTPPQEVEQAAADLKASGCQYRYYLPLSPQIFTDTPAFDPAAFGLAMQADLEALTRGCEKTDVVGPAWVFRLR